MTNNSCSTTEVDEKMKMVNISIFIPILIIGIFLNTGALYQFCKICKIKKFTAPLIYTLNLTLFDILLLIQLTCRLIYADKKLAPEQKTLCSFMESVYFISTYGSIYTIVAIAVNRYIGINHPFSGKFRSKKVAWIYCFIIWVGVGSATTRVYKFHDDESGNFTCFHKFSNAGWGTGLILCLEFFGFFLPAAVIIVCSCRSIHTLKASITVNQTGVAIIYSSMVAFLVPFTPYHLAIFLQYLVNNGFIVDCGHKQGISYFIQVLISLTHFNSCLDAACYYYMIKEVRPTFMMEIKRRLSSNRVRTISTSEV